MSDPVWVTYAEAAERLGISVEGVRLKVKRDQKLGKDAKLRVRRDNSGRMLLAWDKALLDQHVGPHVGSHMLGRMLGLLGRWMLELSKPWPSCWLNSTRIMLLPRLNSGLTIKPSLIG